MQAAFENNDLSAVAHNMAFVCTLNLLWSLSSVRSKAAMSAQLCYNAVRVRAAAARQARSANPAVFREVYTCQCACAWGGIATM